MRKILFILAILAFLPPLALAQAPGVEVLWEARSYVPPLYEGKALYPRGGSFRAVAVPAASLGDPAALSYRWKVDGTVLGSASGRGRYAIDVASSMFDPSPLVTVDVLDAFDNVLAVGAVRIPFAEPQLLVYENKPLGGVQFGRAIRAAEPLTRGETTFEAYPYFFSVPSRLDSALAYRWSVGGARPAVAGPTITLQTPEGEGSAQVSLSVQHLKTLVQRASAAFDARFNNTDTASPLSLFPTSIAYAQEAKPVPLPLLTKGVPYISGPDNTYTPGVGSLATYLSNLFLLGIGIILTGAVVMMTINALKGMGMASATKKMDIKEWGNDIWYAIGMVVALYVVLFAINPELTRFRLVETLQDAVRRASEIVRENEPPGEVGGGDPDVPQPSDGTFVYRPQAEAQRQHASPVLGELMSCMAGLVPGQVGHVTSISDHLITSGERTFQQCARGGCSHPQPGSAHYGGTGCIGQSYAVDFGDENHLGAINRAAKECDPSASVEKHPNAAGDGGFHVHVSVGPAQCR